MGLPKLISIIVPVLNEQDTIQLFLDRTYPCLETAIQAMGEDCDYEIIFVDDGSTDATLAAITAAHKLNPRIKIVVLSRNFGKDAAVAAGLRHSRGGAVVPIDVDLQDPPEIIPELVRHWLDGAQVVTAVRSDRSADSTLKRLSAQAFYTVYNRIADQEIRRDASDFQLLDRQVVHILNQLPERARFMKGLFSWVGFTSSVVPYAREPRAKGSTKWNYWRLWNFALDAITSSTTTPLRIWTYCGILIGTAAFLYALFIIVITLFFGRDVPGYASLMVAILFIGGINLIALGILGEYIGRIFNDVKGRPLYIVQSKIGFEQDEGMQTSLEHD